MSAGIKASEAEQRKLNDYFIFIVFFLYFHCTFIDTYSHQQKMTIT